MSVISIGTDRRIFEPESEVAHRVKEQGEKSGPWRVIVLSGPGFTARQLSPEVWLYPTNSRSRWGYFSDAVQIGRRLPRPDLVTAQDPFECGWIGRRLARYHGAKLELQIHTDLGSPYFWRESIKNKIRFLLAKFLVPRADRVRVVSARIKDFLVSRWRVSAEKIEVRPIVVPPSSARWTPPARAGKNILMVCRLEREKNVALALRAVAVARARRPDLKLTIVGAGREEEKLKRLAAELGLNNAVVFAGWTDSPATYYQDADLFLQTSDYEGYGLALAEARAAGLPAVSTDVGVAAELGARIVEHNAASGAAGIIDSLS